DDFVSRKILHGHLTQFGDCDVATDGVEAVEAIKNSFEKNKPYDLIFLDIMMPNMDGQEALAKIRKIEQSHDIAPGDGTKIIMTTALSDAQNILKAFNCQCEAYIVKPITREKIINQLVALNFIQHDAAG
ncbi:response regulator, partial [bacterium AH-315-I18]|nr:response regulator [bacterium AH-315-I18]